MEICGLMLWVVTVVGDPTAGAREKFCFIL